MGPHLPQPLGTFPKEAPVTVAMQQLCRPCLSTWCAHRPAQHRPPSFFWPLLSAAFVLLNYFSSKGAICKLQTAEKQSLGVAQSPKQAQCSCARPPKQFTPQNCVIDLPRSLKSLMAASTAEPAVRWGHRPIPTPVMPAPSHHCTFRTHFSHPRHEIRLTISCH